MPVKRPWATYCASGHNSCGAPCFQIRAVYMAERLAEQSTRSCTSSSCAHVFDSFVKERQSPDEVERSRSSKQKRPDLERTQGAFAILVRTPSAGAVNLFVNLFVSSMLSFFLDLFFLLWGYFRDPSLFSHAMVLNADHNWSICARRIAGHQYNPVPSACRPSRVSSRTVGPSWRPRDAGACSLRHGLRPLGTLSNLSAGVGFAIASDDLTIRPQRPQRRT